MLAISELLKNWKLVIGAVAVLAMAGVLLYLNTELGAARAATVTVQHSLDTANSSIGTYKAQIATLQADNVTLAGKLTEQSQAVQNLADAGQAARDAVARALAAAAAQKATSAATIAALQAKIKQNPTESCHDAINDWRNSTVPDVAGL